MERRGYLLDKGARTRLKRRKREKEGQMNSSSLSSEVALEETSRLGLDEDARDEREPPDDLLARLGDLVTHVQVGNTDQTQKVSSVSDVKTRTRGKALRTRGTRASARAGRGSCCPRTKRRRGRAPRRTQDSFRCWTSPAPARDGRQEDLDCGGAREVEGREKWRVRASSTARPSLVVDTYQVARVAGAVEMARVKTEKGRMLESLTGCPSRRGPAVNARQARLHFPSCRSKCVTGQRFEVVAVGRRGRTDWNDQVLDIDKGSTEGRVDLLASRQIIIDQAQSDEERQLFEGFDVVGLEQK